MLLCLWHKHCNDQEQSEGMDWATTQLCPAPTSSRQQALALWGEKWVRPRHNLGSWED